MRSTSLVMLLSLAAPAVFGAEPEAEPAAAPEAAVTPNAPSAAEAQAAKAARRERFELHRSVGFVGEALQLGSLAFFALDDWQRFGGGGGSRSFSTPEIALGSAAEVAILVNYLIAATAPSRPGGTTGANILHQTLMYAAAASNIARVVIAVMLAGATSVAGNQDLITAHRVTAIAAPVLFAGAAAIQYF